MQGTLSDPTVLIVIPCLNEADHIEALLEQMRRAAQRLSAVVVVADGGSSDGTQAIVGRMAAADPRICLLHNPKKLQSAGINLAVDRFGDAAHYLVRIDAHGSYPEDYCDVLIAEARERGADAVVVSMETAGTGLVQRATAAAENTRLGNGGSKHRLASDGQWIDHGHHALMRIGSFRAVGGYDETFSHNEDAELDHRLVNAGYRIWLTARTRMTYLPREMLDGLFRQYFSYGRGRARTMLKHRMIPKVRQVLPISVLPVVAFAILALINWLAAVPAGIWLAVCLAYGGAVAWRSGEAALALSGVSAAVMHLAWSAGFWLQWFLGIAHPEAVK